MTFFSRCDTTQRFEPAVTSPTARRVRVQDPGSGMGAVLKDFAEDLGILFRYAAGLDYYGRDRRQQGR